MNEKNGSDGPPPSDRAIDSDDAEASDGSSAEPEILTPSEDAPEDKPKVIARSVQYQGPLPPPNMVREYEKILPGSADRIFKMAEEEQVILKKLNSKSLTNDRIKIFGSIIVSALLILAAAYCIYSDYPLTGLGFGSVGLLSGIIATVIRLLKTE